MKRRFVGFRRKNNTEALGRFFDACSLVVTQLSGLAIRLLGTRARVGDSAFLLRSDRATFREASPSRISPCIILPGWYCGSGLYSD